VRVQVYCCERVNIRSGPGESYDVLNGAEPGRVLTVTGRDATGNWLRLNYGWIALRVVSVEQGSISNLPVVSR
jgi:uncharacterized protein YraI